MNQGHEALGQEIKRGRQRVVRPAFQRERAGAGGRQQRGKHGLQHQSGAAGRAHGKPVIARRHRPRAELQHLRAQRGSNDLGATDRPGRLDGSQVLAQQPRLLAPGSDALHAKRLARHQRQRQGRAQDLAAALAF